MAAMDFLWLIHADNIEILGNAVVRNSTTRTAKYLHMHKYILSLPHGQFAYE